MLNHLLDYASCRVHCCMLRRLCTHSICSPSLFMTSVDEYWALALVVYRTAFSMVCYLLDVRSVSKGFMGVALLLTVPLCLDQFSTKCSFEQEDAGKEARDVHHREAYSLRYQCMIYQASFSSSLHCSHGLSSWRSSLRYPLYAIHPTSQFNST